LRLDPSIGQIDGDMSSAAGSTAQVETWAARQPDNIVIVATRSVTRTGGMKQACRQTGCRRQFAKHTMLNATMLNAGRAGPSRCRHGSAIRGHLRKKTAIAIVTGAFQPVFSFDFRLAGGPGRAPFAKPGRRTREFLCCELQKGMILPLCNLQCP
jgi:hypothetical protein